MTQEVLKLALEALEHSHANEPIWKTPHREAITAIKEALREHAMREVQRLGQEIEQEPVVGITAIRTWFKDGRVVTQTLCNSWVDTTPPQPEQEPVAWMSEHRFDELRKGFTVMTTLTKQIAFEDDVALYTTPPQRKPLTDEEIAEFAQRMEASDPTDSFWREFARAIEAAHGIKE
jgi:hypothetical protein